jgi:hypothetical protein
MRRLRAMAVLDGEINQGVRARDARRAQIAREILKRTGQTKRLDAHQAQAADILSMLTSFETYDALAQGGQTYDQIVANVGALARSALAPLLPPTPMPRARSDEARQRKPPV